MAPVRATMTGTAATHDEDTAATWMTCAPDLVEHVVTDESFAAGRSEGVFDSVCGARVVAASMLSAPRTRCSICRHRVTAPHYYSDDEGMTPRQKPGRVRRLLGRWFR
ncbi:hypothetical protein [Prauserella halophila]|nr:hypothetical protein [Prauserella halophila]